LHQLMQRVAIVQTIETNELSLYPIVIIHSSTMAMVHGELERWYTRLQLNQYNSPSANTNKQSRHVCALTDDAGKSSPAGHRNGAVSGRDEGRTAKKDSNEEGNAVTAIPLLPLMALVILVLVDADGARVVTDIRGTASVAVGDECDEDEGCSATGGNGGGISSPSPDATESSDAWDALDNAFGRPPVAATNEAKPLGSDIVFIP
jgi:hypothetical protein